MHCLWFILAEYVFHVFKHTPETQDVGGEEWGGGVLRLLKGNRVGLTTLLVPHAGTQEGALSRGPVVTPFLRWAHFCF